MIDVPDQVRDYLRPNMAWLALLAALVLTALGVAAIDVADPRFTAPQVRWLPIAWVAMLACLLPHPRQVGMAALPLMIVSLALLVLLVLPGVPRGLVPVRNGARCWIDLHFMMFQPAELAKILCILALARYLRFRENYRTFLGLLIPFAIMFVPVVLLLKQPDLGMSLLFPPALFAMLIAAGARLRHISALLAIGALVVALVVLNALDVLPLPNSMQVLKPHQRSRIVSMVSLAQDDMRYARTSAYQQDKAMTLTGAGGMTGNTPEHAAALLRYNRLPEVHNDMIFAVIVTRWGLSGGLAMLGGYLLLIGGFIAAAGRSKDPFARLSIVGFAGLLIAQVTINVGMTVGLLPITGLTLPFISYGGSSLVATYIMVGLVINFASRRPAIVNRPTFEFDRADAILQ